MEDNPESPAAAAAGSWGESVTQALQMGEESEVSAVDPLLLGGVSDDAPEPNYAEALASQGEESTRGGREHMPNPVGDQPPLVQIARAATPASPGHSELSRMEGGGVVAKWDPDDDELVPDYASMPVVPEGSGSYPQGSQGMEDTQRLGKRTTHAAMDVDEPGGEVRINSAQGLTVEAVVQRQVLSIFQSQVTPLLGQLMDRLEAMEARQNAERATPHTNIEAATLGQDTLAGDFQKMMSLGVESVASDRKMVASRVSVEGRIEHASQHRPSSVDDTPNPQSRATAGASGGVGQRAGPGEERSGVVMVSGIDHAWRLTPEGLQLVIGRFGIGGTEIRPPPIAAEVKTSTAELQKLVINDGDKDVSPLLAGDWLTLAGLHLILKAIPNSLKEELVSTQRMSCIDAVAKIFCTYQPGGLKERSALLRFLTTPESSSDVNVALKHLKRWARWYRRAEDLQVSLPDSTLLLAGLDLLTSKALSKFPETQFRLSSFRYSQNIDMVPTSEKVCALAEMLQAELEVLDTGKGSKGGKKGSEEQPKGDAGAAAGAAQTVALAEGETYMGVSAFGTLIGSADSDARSHMGYRILSYSLSGW
ncbi:hypothetical protein AK812_SmicGene23478 [Symbiodinium microadriaticum]|uniref:Uncharacterized protein n=1 Tax=Symbiodinium microadriaticum TaxID=2951 RepID=A0A1Q9DH39_SYMMI|nr:hypothetical protein AK812_SmicGene23478 [Symbiodinium microadriaticum]